jgi:hypothetical protein
MGKNFKNLSEPEILALAISNEETDGRSTLTLPASEG